MTDHSDNRPAERRQNGASVPNTAGGAQATIACQQQEFIAACQRRDCVDRRLDVGRISHGPRRRRRIR